ncbi:MAG: GldG family protein [Clostridia bacterium]|nr:GldG family protein [Clostridia bacterium]
MKKNNKNEKDEVQSTEVHELSEVEVKSNVQLSANLGQPQQKVKINTKKIKYNSLTTVSTALVLAVIILINVAVGLAGERFNLSLDLTEEQVFTLDQQTLDYLSELETPVELIIAGEEKSYSSSVSETNAISPLRYVYETLINYANENPNITVHYVNPRLNPMFFKSRGISLDDGTDTAENIFMVVYCPETQRFRYIKDTIFENLQYVGFERRVTSAILYTTKKDIQTVAFVQGHGESTYAYFQQLLIENGFDAKSIKLQDFDSILGYDIDILVIANPSRGYSVDDINKIDEWLSNNEELGKHLMVFTDLNTKSNKYLEEYLLEWGLSLGTESIFDTSNSYTFTNAMYPLLKVQYGQATAIIAEELAKGGYNQFIQLGAARAVYTEFETKDSIQTYPMIITADSAFSRFTASTNLSSTEWKNFKKQDGDTVGPFNLSVLSQKIRYEDTTAFTSSVYLCGSTSFIDDYFISNIDGNNAQTAEYMIKLIKYLVSSTQDYDTNILPTQLIFDSLNFTETHQIISVFLGLIFGIPVLFAIIGIIVHRRRKFL